MWRPRRDHVFGMWTFFFWECAVFSIASPPPPPLLGCSLCCLRCVVSCRSVPWVLPVRLFHGRLFLWAYCLFGMCCFQHRVTPTRLGCSLCFLRCIVSFRSVRWVLPGLLFPGWSPLSWMPRDPSFGSPLIDPAVPCPLSVSWSLDPRSPGCTLFPLSPVTSLIPYMSLDPAIPYPLTRSICCSLYPLPPGCRLIRLSLSPGCRVFPLSPIPWMLFASSPVCWVVFPLFSPGPWLPFGASVTCALSSTQYPLDDSFSIPYTSGRCLLPLPLILSSLYPDAA